jgi:alpha-galactosidase
MAKIDTLGYIGDDPATAGMLQDMLNPDGTPRTVENVWISNYQSNVPNDPAGEGFGPLTAGYGGRSNATELGQNFGPEFSFGIYIQELVDAPVLIIKTAWGGKSLYEDFRPPSAGPFGLSEADAERIAERGGDLDAERAKRAEGSGVYYRLMMDHVRHVLSDIAWVYPGYDEQQGYELCGFVWFQGWNDMVNSGVYPRRGQPGGYDEYSRLLTLFIRDVRKDLGVPDLPFVIGVMGVNGPIENVNERYRAVHGGFREAMAAPAALDEFKGNVVAVRTAPFWDLKLDALVQKRDAYNGRVKQLKNQEQKGEITSDTLAAELKDIESEALSQEEEETLKRGASNAAYHYLGCGKTMALIGKAFAEAAFELQED